MAFCGVLGGKEVRFCGLVAQNALSASQAVREMSIMVNERIFACKKVGPVAPLFLFTVCRAATHRKAIFNGCTLGIFYLSAWLLSGVAL